jgi:outer membrane protein assembly factor BamA
MHGLISLLIFSAALSQPPPCVPSPADTSQATAPLPSADQARALLPASGFSAAEAALLVPRILLYPPRVASQLLFWPARQTYVQIERHHVGARVHRLLYNDAGTAGVLPAASYQSLFGWTVGLRAFHNDLFGNGERLAAKLDYGGVYDETCQIKFRAEEWSRRRLWIEARARFDEEPRLIFQGIGDLASAAPPPWPADPRQAQVESRFEQQRWLALLGFGVTFGDPGKPLRAGLISSLNRRRFRPLEHGDDDDRSITEVYDTSQVAGFNNIVHVWELLGRIEVDRRNLSGLPWAGYRVDGFCGGTLPINDYRYAHYGLEGTTYVDLYATDRVLALHAALEGVAGREEEIPFTELPRLGGDERLRGYPLDRFRDKIAALATIEYRYPIHQVIAAHLFLDFGRVVPRYASLFDDGLSGWRKGYGAGLLLGSPEGQVLQLDAGFSSSGFHFSASTDPLDAFARLGKRL